MRVFRKKITFHFQWPAPMKREREMNIYGTSNMLLEYEVLFDLILTGTL